MVFASSEAIVRAPRVTICALFDVARLAGGVGVAHQRCADARDLVGGDADADSGAANQNGPIEFTCDNGGSHAISQVGVKGVLGAIDAGNLFDLIFVREMLGEDFRKTFAGAVAGNCNLHGFSPLHRSDGGGA